MPNAGSLRCVPVFLAAYSCSGPPPELLSVRPVHRDIESALSTNGRIEATGRVSIHVATAGRVERVFAQPGDRVRRGQLLLRLADTGQAAARARAAARVDSAKSRLAQLEAGPDPARSAVLQSERSKLFAAVEHEAQELERLRRLVARNAAPRSELEAKQRLLGELKLDVQALDAQLEARPSAERRSELKASLREAEAALGAAVQNANQLSLRAPADGLLYSLPAVQGEFLAAGELAARIGLLDKVRAVVFVDEPDLGKVDLGDVARVTADAYPGREWNCVVDRLATEIVEVGPRRVGQVSCTALSPDRHLLPNLSVGIRVVTDQASQVLSLPRSAVQRSDGRAFVWVARDGKAARREVDTGVEGPVFIEIRHGVTTSDFVLIAGDEPLADGQQVEILVRGDTDG